MIMLNQWDWKEEAACKNESELFFSLAKGQRSRMDREEAIAICEQCPVRQECFDFAIENQEEFGVWGGRDFNKKSTERVIAFRVRKYRRLN